jgi:dTDP-4-amino-4,6-dideoxygalactose transaminase
LNAALACAQLENLESFILNKRETAKEYSTFFKDCGINFADENQDSRANYWLNAILLENETERDQFLMETNESGVMTRPIWTLLHRLNYLSDALHDNLENSIFIEKRLVNIPSSVRI